MMLRMRQAVAVSLYLAIMALASLPAIARGHGHSHFARAHVAAVHFRAPAHIHYARPRVSRRDVRARTYHTARYAQGVPRDSRGRIARSSSEKREFERITGHPRGWKGHVVDHIVPLKRGGADAPSNMQWQTKAEAKAKDKVE